MIIQLTDWLYQGNAQAISDGEYRNHNIGAIICLNENNERYFPESNNGPIDYLWCPFNDPGKTLTIEKIEAIVTFAKIFKAKKVYVHCYGGSNRSSAICALLLHEVDGMPPEDACLLIRAKNQSMGIYGELEKKILELTGKHVHNINL